MKKIGFVAPALVGVCSVVALVGVVRGEQRTQNFLTEPADWIGFNNREGLNDFGWSNSDNVGLGAGEAGGFLARDGGTPDFAYYATNIGSLDASDEAFNFSGTLVFKAPQLDYFMIGFLTAADGLGPQDNPGNPGNPRNFFGFYSDDRYVSARWFADGSGVGSPAILDRFPLDTQLPFSLAYDPNGNGGTGTVSGEFGGFPFSSNLPVDTKDEFHNFTDFGIVTRNAHNNGTINERATPTYVDDLSYTASDAPPLLIGDYNDNQVVDAADYVVWRDNEGTSNPLANRDPGATGPIGAQDYDNWRAAFGNMAAVSGATVISFAVPEPSSIALVLIVCGVALLKRRSCRQGF